MVCIANLQYVIILTFLSSVQRHARGVTFRVIRVCHEEPQRAAQMWVPSQMETLLKPLNSYNSGDYESGPSLPSSSGER